MTWPLYIDNPKAYTENLLKLINQSENAAGYNKINVQESIGFYIVAIKISKIKLRKHFHLQQHQKK
jgi:hypothetical protein